MVDILAPPAIFAALLACLGFVLYRAFAGSRKRIAQWASENGFLLCRFEWHFAGDTPFGLRGGWDVVWTVRVTNREGQVRDGWVRCGNPFLGVLSRRVDVRWATGGTSAFR